MKKVLLIMMILVASMYAIGQEVSQAPVLSEEGIPVDVSTSGGLRVINQGNQGDFLAIWALPSTGNTSAFSRAPSNFYKYQRTEYLVTPAEMAACGFPIGSDIQSIGWLINAAGVGNLTGTLNVWLKNTTDIAYGLGTAWTTTGFTQVHSDAAFSVPITVGAYTVMFNGATPFTYTGGGVYVAWEFSSPTGTVGTTGVSAFCNVNLASGLYGGRSATALPTTLGASSFRPATTFGNNGLVDIIAINNVYALGQVASPFANPTDIRVSVTNGSAASTTFDLTVTVKDSLTGTTRFTSTQTGLTLNANSSNIFTFTGWSPTLLEKVIITAEAPAAPGENFIFNNNVSAKAQVNNSLFSHNYNIVNPGGWGFNVPPRIFLAKYRMSGSGVVASANILIGNSTDNLGDVVYAVVLNSSGTIVAQSANDTLVTAELGMYKNYTFPTPPSFCNEDFFIGLAQLSAGFPMGAVSESPVRPNTFYSCDISGGILNMSTSAKYCLDAVVTSYSGVCNPTSLVATPVSGNQLNLSWVQNLTGNPVMLVYNTTNSFGAPVNGTSYVAGNTLPGGGTVIYVGPGTTFSHTGLTPSTTYYYRAYSYDGSTNYSPYVAGSGATYFGVTYFQNFDAGTTLPAGWSGDMAVEATHGTLATNGLTYDLYDGAPACQSVSPHVTLSANPCRLIFDYRIVDWDAYPLTPTTLGPNDKMEVQISTNSGSTWTTIYTINSATHTTSMDFVTKTFDLSAYPSATIKVRFLGTWGSGDYYVDIDNFLLEEMPLCSTPTALNATNITTTSATIGWSNANFTEIDYGPVGHTAGTGTIVSPVVNNPYTLNGLTVNTAYDVYVRQDCGSGVYSAWAGPLNFSTLNVINIAPALYNFGSVNVGNSSASQTFTITNNGPATTIESVYLSGPDMLQFTLTDGNTYPMNFANGASYTVSVIFNPSTTGAKSALLNVQEPEQAPYTAALSGTALCPVPTSLTATNITTTSAELGWNANGTTTWEIEYGLYGFTQGTGTMITAGVTNPYTLSGLTEGLTYSFYVRSSCNGGFSAWAGPSSFTILCSPFAIPYSENFDAVTVPGLPLCWSRYYSAALRPWQTSSSTSIGAHSAPNFAGVFYHSTLPKNEWLVSPPTQVTAGVSYQVKFWVQAPGWGGIPEKMKVVMSGSNALASLQSAPVIWDNSNMLLSGYTQFTVPFTAATTGTYYFAWHAYSSADVDYIALDDITFEIIPLAVTGTVTNATCEGACNGSIATITTGGTAPYTYLWSDGVTTAQRSALCAGSYSVTVTDAAAGTATGSWTVNQPSAVTATGTVTNLTCSTSANGAISVLVSGGTPSYTYIWNTGATTATIQGLAAGTYCLTVYDSYQCFYSNCWTVTSPTAVSADGAVTNASCPGAADGSISLTVTGGTPTYTYLWSTGATTQNLTGVAAGSYSVTVTDANNCTVVNNWTVSNASSVCANVSVAGTVNTTVCYEATNIITVAGGGNVFEVTSPGRATFIAGVMIKYLPGTKVTGGGYMLGKITSPAGPFCTSSKITEVTAGSGETTIVTDRQYFSLFPNPTNGNVVLLQKGDRVYDNVKVEIYSMNGARMMSANMIGEKQHEFRTADLPSGLYFVKVYADQYVETIKLVKTN